jgi:hypothetical protein
MHHPSPSWSPRRDLSRRRAMCLSPRRPLAPRQPAGAPPRFVPLWFDCRGPVTLLPAPHAGTVNAAQLSSDLRGSDIDRLWKNHGSTSKFRQERRGWHSGTIAVAARSSPNVRSYFDFNFCFLFSPNEIGVWSLISFSIFWSDKRTTSKSRPTVVILNVLGKLFQRNQR